MMDGSQQLEIVVPMVSEIIGNIRPDQLQNATPCRGWVVRDVLEHMVGGATTFAFLLRGEAAPDLSGRDLLGDDPGRAFDEAVGAFGTAAALPGALDRTIAAPVGEMRGSDFLRFVALDGLIHASDLATATDQPFTPPDELVAEIDVFAHDAITPSARGDDSFAAAVDPPAGADPLQRLLAFSGRRP
jgi:uncharacterized protein (TIGR03086 family)